MGDARWYVSFHGGTEPHARNAIYAYDGDGREIGSVLNEDGLPPHLALRELRGFGFGPDGALYVANAHRDNSRIMRFHGAPNADGRHAFESVFVRHHAGNPGLIHPFHVAFGPDGNLYVPSQDTSVVSRFYGPQATAAPPGEPMPHPPALAEVEPAPLPGTFVPQARHAPHGLRAVRHAIFGPGGRLFVADRDGDRVRIYDGDSGHHLDDLTDKHLDGPVHLAFGADGELYVGSERNDAILRCDVERGHCKVFVKPRAGGLHAPAGLAFGPDGDLYVASRRGKEVLRFDAATGHPAKHPFISGLPDNPEFILPVAIGDTGG